jgi:PhzF family phenazine biosynthesis protein
MKKAGIPIYQVDAFTHEAFRGNPAAVCILVEEREASWMQSVAAEMNLSETAFVRQTEGGFALRWFTPKIEVPLCGHATLATAHVLWESKRLDEARNAVFRTRSGELSASREKRGITLDLPAYRSEEAELPQSLARSIALRAREVRLVPKEMGEDNYLIELESERAVRELAPDLAPLRTPRGPGMIVTARGGGEFDFVSRYFVPWAGIDEDPVTGSAHCALAPYWAARLGKTKMKAFQASARGGVLGIEVNGNRVRLTGEAVTVLSGELRC